MSAVPVMPAASFELLFDDSDDAGPRLPPPFRAVYGGEWALPAEAELAYVYVNFVVSRDGRVSFNEPGHLGGGDVSGFDERDRWLMALLRARADAVLVGEGTLRAEAAHVWTAEWLCPEDAAAFTALRAAERRRPYPLQVFLSLAGELPEDAAVFGRPELEVLVATTAAGARRLRGEPGLEALELGADEVDLRTLVDALARRHGVRTLLCEGGPGVYGSLLRSGVGCDEFLTLSPLVLGESAAGPARPSLVEGVAFPPGEAPSSRLLSLRRGGNHLYLRSRYPGA